MKVPVQKLVKSLYSSNYSACNNSGTKRLFWSMLTQARGEVEVDINEVISAYYDDDSFEIIALVQDYANSAEIAEFLKHTKGLINDKTYSILEAVKANRINREVDSAIKRVKEDKIL